MWAPYDEFALFHENCYEYGLLFPDGGPVVSQVRVVLDDGRVISALKWGVATPELVLLHDGAQNAHTWHTVALALGRPLLAIDLPSHGNSDGAANGVNSPISGAARTSPRRSTPSRPLRRSLIVGMSFGGLT